ALLGIITVAKNPPFNQSFYETILITSGVIPALFATRASGRGFSIDKFAMTLLLAFALLAGQWYTTPEPSRIASAQNVVLHNFLRRSFPPHSRALGFRGGDLIQSGFYVPFTDLLQIELLARRGLVTDAHLMSQIQAQWFKVILLDFDLGTEKDPAQLNHYLTEPTRKAIQQNYVLRGTVPAPEPEKLWDQNKLYIYVPKPRETENPPAATVPAADKSS
ncbi:MAG: hypothetical protein WB630_11320, partial [Candidatus Acidiferrales bacterium]